MSVQPSDGEHANAEEPPEHLKESAKYLGISLAELLSLSAGRANQRETASISARPLNANFATSSDSGYASVPGGISSERQGDLLAGISPHPQGLGEPFPDILDPFSYNAVLLDQQILGDQLASQLASANTSYEDQGAAGRTGEFYGCDAAFYPNLEKILGSNQTSNRNSFGNVSDDWVHVDPAWSGDLAENSSEESAELVAEDAIQADLPAHSGLAAHSDPLLPIKSENSSDEGVTHMKYQRTLMPKPSGFSSSNQRLQSHGRKSMGASSDAAAARIRKKRRPYSDSKIRKETHLTRQMNACVRCRMQRNRCNPDPENPRGPCLPCQQKMTRMTRLPCLRYKVTDSTLYRTGLDYMLFYRKHPMVGPEYGDFHIEKQWICDSTRFLDITQDRSPAVLTLELREFEPPEERDLDLKGRSMYYNPWAIADPEKAVAAVNDFADQSVAAYLEALLDDTNSFVWDVFHAALRLSLFPEPNELLRDVLRLWVVCRFIESRWRCCGLDMVNADSQQDPFYDWVTPPPYVDYQLASVIIQRVLGPLRRSVLQRLQDLFLENKSSNWYSIFLVSFILLHNYELQILFQRQFAARRQARERYLDMPLVRATHSGAKTILAHFHYCCKGQRPFRPDFDWKSAKIRKMAQLDAEQCAFMERFHDQVQQKSATLQEANGSDQYDKEYWFLSQLFESNWFPRDTHEYSPLA
ncbi:MAG: hypothetical protein Q9227_005243 [Pyrenula ochraceoflavens]